MVSQFDNDFTVRDGGSEKIPPASLVQHTFGEPPEIGAGFVWLQYQPAEHADVVLIAITRIRDDGGLPALATQDVVETPSKGVLDPCADEGAMLHRCQRSGTTQGFAYPISPCNDGAVIPVVRQALPTDLRKQIEACGFFPELVMDSIQLAVGPETPQDFLVHHEAIFSDEIHRHLTVLVLTPTRLIVGHTDENPDSPSGGGAVTSTESVPLHRLGAVAMTRVVSRPERFPGPPSEVVETWLTLGWGTMRKVDLESGHCGDPDCEADHGYSGTAYDEDIVVRMSPAADGAASVARLEAFGTALQQVAGIRR